ncbi:MAG: hypothetical protein ACK559_16430, partial [bacterium]
YRILLQHLVHPPQSDPVAIVAESVFANIGMNRNAVPCFPTDCRRRRVFIELDVGHDPDSESLAARPADGRPGGDRGVTDEVADGFHGVGSSLAGRGRGTSRASRS